MRWLIAPFTWLGRVTLWFLLLPVGIWRSIHHGRKKTERKIMAEVQKAQATQAAPLTIRGIPSDTLPPAP